MTTAPTTVRVQEAPFDLAAESAALTAGREDVGGVASFVGLCRADDGLEALVLEHYPGMTERAIAGIAAEACARTCGSAAELTRRPSPRRTWCARR